MIIGRGVSYCATCDRNLYKDCTIVVVCGSIEKELEVDYLANLAKTVYYFPLFKDSKIKNDNVIVVNDKIKEIRDE